MEFRKSYSWQTWSFFLVTLALVLVGLLFVYSASSVFALEKFGRATYFVSRQALGIVLGSVLGFVVFLIPIRWIFRLSPYLYLTTLAVTILTLLPQFSLRVHGSARWLRLFGFSLQPSEFLKLTFILYVAYLLVQKQYQRRSFWNSFLPLILIFGLTATVLLKQPDFGLTVVLSVALFILLLIAKFSGEYLFIISLIFIPAASLLVWLKPYRLKRILTFLNPWNDPQGAGFQIIQSLIAIGSGGWRGLGLGNSRQKFFYLPMQHTDFIFAIIAEELGLIGSIAIVMLYMLWLYFGVRLALSVNDDYAAFVILGFVILINLQALINLCVVTGLFPTKGVGLPFISYGCSGLISNLMMMGIVLRAACSDTRIYR